MGALPPRSCGIEGADRCIPENARRGNRRHRAPAELDLPPGRATLTQPLAIGVMMSAHTTSRLSGRSHGLGAAPTLLRCNHCRGELGLGIHRYWHMQFCSSTCMAAYQQRLAPETKEKICRLDVPSEDQTSGSNLPQPRVSWPALWGFDFHSIF